MLESLGRPLRRIKLDPIEAPLIRKLIDLALTGVYNISAICDEAVKLGMTGKISKKKIAPQTITDLLSNVFFIGKFKYNREIQEKSIEVVMNH